MTATTAGSAGAVTTAGSAGIGDFPPLKAVRAPLYRLLRSELRWVLRRPRTLIAIGLLGLVPVLIGVAIVAIGGPNGGRDGGGGVLTMIAGNGFVLPIAALTISLALLLPLVGAMSAADALAGEFAHGTMRGLLMAPVSRTRLLGIKAFGVASVVLIAVFVISAVGVITGLILVGTNGMLTMSGTTLSVGAALSRVLIAALWVAVQVWAVGAVALAVSSFTEHPLVVMAATLAGAIVFGVLSVIPALDWLRPYLLTEGWSALTDVLRDPMPTDGLLTGLGRAACYILIGLSVAMGRMITKDG
jgi:ABC-2 type transport system permease protein